MPGILRTPTDMSAPPQIGAALSPPIIPGKTNLSPGTMREVMRADMGLGDMMPDEQADEQADEQEQPTENSLLAEFGNLYWKAGEYPGLQDVMLDFIKALKKSADMRNAVSNETLLRMPTPMIAPEAAPREDLGSSLLGA